MTRLHETMFPPCAHRRASESTPTSCNRPRIPSICLVLSSLEYFEFPIMYCKSRVAFVLFNLVVMGRSAESFRMYSHTAEFAKKSWLADISLGHPNISTVWTVYGEQAGSDGAEMVFQERMAENTIGCVEGIVRECRSLLFTLKRSRISLIIFIKFGLAAVTNMRRLLTNLFGESDRNKPDDCIVAEARAANLLDLVDQVDPKLNGETNIIIESGSMEDQYIKFKRAWEKHFADSTFLIAVYMPFRRVMNHFENKCAPPISSL